MSRSILPARRAVTALAASALLAGAGLAGAQPASGAPSTTTAATAATAARPAASNGLQALSWTDGAGTSSTYRLFTSQVNAARPVGLVVYLDGDGMHGHDNPRSSWALGGSRGVVAQAAARGYATLSIRTPDRQGTPTFWENGAVNANYVAALTRKVSAQLGTNRTWLVGFSGGSQLITKFLLPRHGSMFVDGGAVITGGGGAPSRASSPAKPANPARFPMVWYTGSADTGSGGGYNALADARRGQAFYAAKGFRTALQVPAGLDHGDHGTRFGTWLASQLDRYPAAARR